ncbi:MAG: carboxylesterase family protein, partial [Sandaracinaceae bacterium]
PTGSRRWRPPAPALPFPDGELDASRHGSVCPQGAGEDRRGDEDCLTLDVWAPRASGPRPVMVFIHGGSFVSGSGSLELYDGARLAHTGDVVVVTLNYRLGPLGFLTTDSLAAESGTGSVGNYGILDQIAALEWVRDNIAGFGGDPTRVTVFGESAGSISICALLGSPLADGLFHRAILESGGGCYGFTTPADAIVPPSRLDRGRALLDGLGCHGSDELDCARAASVDAVLDALSGPPAALSTHVYAAMLWGPTIDGVVLREDPGARIARAEAPRIPVMIGMNHDEATIFTIGETIHAFNYRQRLAELAGEAHADALVSLYPIGEHGTAHAAFDAAATDLVLGCDVERLAAARTAAGAPTYLYELTRTFDGLLGRLGSVHGIELPYVFGNFGRYRPTAEDLEVSRMMQTAWTSFARDGAPTSTPTWPPYARGTASAAFLDAPLTVRAGWRDGRCEALRDMGLVE